MLLMEFLISKWETFVLLTMTVLGHKSGPAVDWAELESNNMSRVEKSCQRLHLRFSVLGYSPLLSQILHRVMGLCAILLQCLVNGRKTCSCRGVCVLPHCLHLLTMAFSGVSLVDPGT